jgi:DNA recombination protein RmuC
MEQRLHHFYTDESRQRAALGEQIRLLSELNQTMSLEAKQLTQALKGDNKVQGHWGELILERILESAGLAEGREYRLQHSQNTDEGQRLRPDCLLLLPQDRCVIVDAKVSLTAYERYVNQGQQAQDLREHLLSVRRHLNGLSGKNYPQLQGQKLDFVLLFIPVEAAFALAMQHEPSLFQEAFEKNVFIVSPTTLLVTARTVAYLWKQELMQSNVLEIARQGGLLYDSLAQALSEFDKVGDRLLKTQQQHQQLRHYLQSSLAQRAIKLQQLGAKTSKQLPGTWLAGDEEHLNLFNHDQAL